MRHPNYSWGTGAALACAEEEARALRRQVRFLVAVVVYLVVGLFLALAAKANAGDRVSEYREWVGHYRSVMGVTTPVEFTTAKLRADKCAWVERTGARYTVGLVTGNPRCASYGPEWLARHEVCHLRLKHLIMQPRFSEAAEEAEVSACMRWYNRKGKVR